MVAAAPAGRALGGDTANSKSNEYGTPQTLFDQLHAEFHFDIDAAASAENAKLSAYWTEEDDSLSFFWPVGKSYFLNPPFGGGWLPLFVAKARQEALRGSRVVCLLPARVSEKWWHKLVLPAVYVGGPPVAMRCEYTIQGPEIRFRHPVDQLSTAIRTIKGRLAYTWRDAETGKLRCEGARFPSLIVIFDGLARLGAPK